MNVSINPKCREHIPLDPSIIHLFFTLILTKRGILADDATFRSEGYCIRLCVCPSVCLSVCYYYSATPGYKAAKEKCQQPQCYVGMNLKRLKQLCCMKHKQKPHMLMSLISPLTTFTHFQDQRSTAAT